MASDYRDWVFVAIGANQGDARGNVSRVIERLKEFAKGPVLASSLWQTSPVDCPPGSPTFINAVVGFVPATDQPEELLSHLQSIEAEFGRMRTGQVNAPRPLDLDIITFAGETRSSPRLTLPHPRAHQRRFVLAPLSEIAPDVVSEEWEQRLPAGGVTRVDELDL